jgi:hypothetical protein
MQTVAATRINLINHQFFIVIIIITADAKMLPRTRRN